MIKLKEYKFEDLYEISSGITSTPDQAGKGFPFLSFETVFNNQFLPDALEYINLLVPDNETLKRYNLLTKNLFKKIYLNKIENYKLENLRDWILPAFINGRAKIT